jgi:hypothetical protein
MGSSDPLPTGFEIWFESLNFQATGNDYLMRITNREELRAWRQTGPASAPVAPAAGGSTPTSTDAAGPSAPQRRRRSGQRSRQARTERRQAACATLLRGTPTGETTAAPTGERSVSGPRFPLGLRGATTAYVASANTGAAAHRVLPARRTSAVRDPSASADDESSHGSVDELPPATSHGYAEWEFSGMTDPIMFRRFLDAADYWFGYSNDSSTGSYDPARECFVVLANDPAGAANAVEVGDGGSPPGPGAGPIAPPPSPPRGLTSTHNWLRHVSLGPSWRKNTARCGCFAPPSLEKPPRAVNVLVSWAGKPAIASTPTSTSTTRTLLRERARSSLLPQRCCGPCPPPQHPRRETCTARRRR